MFSHIGNKEDATHMVIGLQSDAGKPIKVNKENGRWCCTLADKGETKSLKHANVVSLPIAGQLLRHWVDV
jgi:hypothetical protein